MVRHILLAADPEDAEHRGQQIERAKALLAELQTGQLEFASLAKETSSCPSAAQGGCLGQISKGQTVSEFERQVLPLPVGLVNFVIETRYGFHLVLIEQRIEGEQLPFELVQERVAEYLQESVLRRAINQYLRRLVAHAKIVGLDLQGEKSHLMQ